MYGKMPVILIQSIAAEKADPWSKDRSIYSYPSRRSKENGIQNIAKGAYVSDASVTRFVKAIGLESFSELREILLKMTIHLSRYRWMFTPAGSSQPCSVPSSHWILRRLMLSAQRSMIQYRFISMVCWKDRQMSLLFRTDASVPQSSSLMKTSWIH